MTTAKTTAKSSPASPAAKPAAKTGAKTGKALTVIQTGATNGHKPGVKGTLIGLGLGRIRASRKLEDTPAIRGMIFKVRHLVTVEEEK